ncbi:hypothetical protein LA345_38845 (plasmid) [Burkholderia vietnamiensis]|uniref:Uncharacterized protein n=1 Tax=Burkholderia vietnamiensis (strain G4 / LMG 22486) TaxID=269482 RepID=A4JWC9_BURVG|nr:hypothetical protein Bcep1808_7712 [Burkholderia vietnamiensis G4]MCB4349757.1 hypothetical protein [Burkholderia vietnamiensis]
MAGNKKPRKKYSGPKFSPVVQRAISFLKIQRNHTLNALNANYDVVLDDDQQRDIAIAYGVAIDRMSKGMGDAEDLGQLGFMANVSRVLCERSTEELDFGKQYEPDIIAAQQALMRAHFRKRAGKTLGFDAVGLQAIRRAYQIHSAQMQVAGAGHLISASAEVTRRQRAGDVMNEEEAMAA